MGVGALEAAFDDGAALLPYLAAGDPGGDATGDIGEAMDRTRCYAQALERGGADVIEVGLPFSEPIADGPTIQEATVRALEAGMTPTRYLELIDDLGVDVPIVAMTYYNPIFRYGDEAGAKAFIEDAAAAGVDGLIVPDLPVEESDPVRAACESVEMGLVFIAAPTTTDERLGRILKRGSGYLYVQARLGTTGASTSISDHTAQTLERIRSFEDREGIDPLPKAVGFGISSGNQAATIVEAGADGIIVGSAFVDIIAEGTNVPERLTTLAGELKAGARRGRVGRVTRSERS